MRLLVVDDSAELLDLLVKSFASEGHELRTARNLAEARAALHDFLPEVIVLDVELPDGSGVELCRELRARQEHCPVLLLTAHGAVHERVAGLDAGADDFLTKPFAVAELRARVRALGRRGPIERPTALVLAGIELDLGARRAFVEQTEVPVTGREWALLEFLLSRRGRVVSRDAILEVVWGDVTEGASASLDVIMARLRRKLGVQLIRTVRGEGYAIDAE
jgi:two-component system OmpR family response regulator